VQESEYLTEKTKRIQQTVECETFAELRREGLLKVHKQNEQKLVKLYQTKHKLLQKASSYSAGKCGFEKKSRK
jgi:hypothetical protein